MTRNAYLFPGQGAQYVGMGKDFFENFALVRQTFEEANDLLKRNLTKIVLEGPEDLLTETRNSQVAIYVLSMAYLRVLESQYPHLKPTYCSGLSLGEYTALTASGHLTFAECLELVQKRGQFMNEACETTPGTMAVVLGLDAIQVDEMVKEVNLPNDLWVANYNCPGQVVISGTLRGIEAGTAAAKAKGVKRVLPLQVHGAFHSGLMKPAEEMLHEPISYSSIVKSPISLVMNVTGTQIEDPEDIKKNLIKQVTHSVRWEQGIRFMLEKGVDRFIEIGCGKALSGFNKRIGVTAPTISIEKVEDLKQL